MIHGSSRSTPHPAALLATVVILAATIASGGVSPGSAQSGLVCPAPATMSVANATASAESPEPVPTPVAFPPAGGDLTVYAAASLTATFEAIKADLETANPDLTITYNFAGSQALVTQLTEGARADVLATANPAQMANAVDVGVIAGESDIFTRNRLTIVVPADNPAGVEAPADLAANGLDLVLAAPEVPAGQYAREAACKMAANPATYGDRFLDGFSGNIVSNEDNVKAVLTKVQLGEAEAGIVYTTDVTAGVAADVLQIVIPPDVNVIATYPIAPVAGGSVDLANAFISYVLSPEGQANLAAFGFEPAP